MVTYLIMVLIALFLAATLLINAKLQPNNNHFFNKTNSNAMRGFWCLIVILVHIPMAYQNRIQDMIGSFAYIGVTFFFMTSAYGLKLGLEKDPESIKTFWRRRLPKLIIPCFLVNMVNVLISLFNGIELSVWNFISINVWVQWLLICYLIFWTAYRFISGRYRDAIICVFVIAFSVVVYLFRNQIARTTWCPEIFGFVWGMILSKRKIEFCAWMNEGWFKKCTLFCVLAGVLGVGYLKFKPVVFWGDYLLKILLGLTIILFMLALNTRIEIGNKVNRFLGEISFEIYLIHGTVFGLISYFLPEINSGLFILISIAVTVGLSVIVQKISQLFLKWQ